MSFSVRDAIYGYVFRILTDTKTKGLKVFLLDIETSGIVSLVCGTSLALKNDVCLFERLDSPLRQSLLGLSAVVFVRPTPANLKLLQVELRQPKYNEYHLFFSNAIETGYRRLLTEVDVHRVVVQVQEFFADYYAINHDFFTLYTGPFVYHEQVELPCLKQRTIEGLFSLLLSFRCIPKIRYAACSAVSQMVAGGLVEKMEQGINLFQTSEISSHPTPLLLILDRKFDLSSPLLLPWTYQSMVHELLGLVKNRVTCSLTTPKLPCEYVLSCDEDPFFHDTMYVYIL